MRPIPAAPATAQIDSYFERWAFPVCIIPSMTIAALVLNFFMFRAPSAEANPLMTAEARAYTEAIRNGIAARRP